MTKRIPLEWTSRAALRLRNPGSFTALADDDGPIPPERYTVLEAQGVIALTAEPKGEVEAEVEGEAAPPAFPAYETGEA